MWRKRIEKRIAVKLVMAFDPDFQCAVCYRSRHTENDVSIVDLTVVQCNLARLVYLAVFDPGSAGDATTVAAPVRQVHALRAQTVEKWYSIVNQVSRATPVSDRNLAYRHIQISLVQSPPG
jgi:hypothetical protein